MVAFKRYDLWKKSPKSTHTGRVKILQYMKTTLKFLNNADDVNTDHLLELGRHYSTGKLNRKLRGKRSQEGRVK